MKATVLSERPTGLLSIRDGDQHASRTEVRGAPSCYRPIGSKRGSNRFVFLHPNCGDVDLQRGWPYYGVEICPLVLYFPPKLRAGRELRNYLACYKKLKFWAAEVLDNLFARVIPLIMVDVNDGVGKVRIRSGWQDVETMAVGPARTDERMIGGAGQRFRELLEDAQMFSASTMGKVVPTFYGCKDNVSMIDHVGVPLTVGNSVVSCGPLRGLGRRLQAIRSRFPRDHLPAHIAFHCDWNPLNIVGEPALGPDEREYQRVVWDKDRMVAGLRGGLDRDICGGCTAGARRSRSRT